MTDFLRGALAPFQGTHPQLGQDVYVAPGAHVLGDVVVGDHASIWYNCVVRGDVMPISIGARTNIQDLTMIHASTGVAPCIIGADVTVGHRAILHGCHVEDLCLIGMGAILLDGVHVERGCLIAAGAVLPPGMRVPAGHLVMGSPGRVKRELRPEELESIRASAAHYVDNARLHATG